MATSRRSPRTDNAGPAPNPESTVEGPFFVPEEKWVEMADPFIVSAREVSLYYVTIKNKGTSAYVLTHIGFQKVFFKIHRKYTLQRRSLPYSFPDDGLTSLHARVVASG